MATPTKLVTYKGPRTLDVKKGDKVRLLVPHHDGTQYFNAGEEIYWYSDTPPTVEQARELTAMAPTALAAFGRMRQGLDVVEPDRSLSLAGNLLYMLTGERPDPASERALFTRNSSSRSSRAR